jgi:hypothetical protein
MTLPASSSLIVRNAWTRPSTNKLGARIDVTWPSGYRGRFVPAFEVVDPSGAVVAHEGQAVTGGCVTTDTHVLHLEPPFK